MIKKPARNEQRLKRHLRIRNKLIGTASAPRLCVFRSNKHIYAQIIDDKAGHTLVSACTNEKELSLTKTSNIEAAKKVGELLAERGKDKGISKVVFDRGGLIYHGRVAAVAEGAREGGLDF